jgi:hypothetical protein
MLEAGLDIARNDGKRFKHKEGGISRQKLMVLRNAGDDLRRGLKIPGNREESLVLVLMLILILPLTLFLVLKLSADIFVNNLKSHQSGILMPSMNE